MQIIIVTTATTTTTTIVIIITIIIITETLSQHIGFKGNQPYVTEDVAYRISAFKGLL
jgi:hypothetical protein